MGKNQNTSLHRTKIIFREIKIILQPLGSLAGFPTRVIVLWQENVRGNRKPRLTMKFLEVTICSTTLSAMCYLFHYTKCSFLLVSFFFMIWNLNWKKIIGEGMKMLRKFLTFCLMTLLWQMYWMTFHCHINYFTFSHHFASDVSVNIFLPF
jgi:hypothetical protein